MHNLNCIISDGYDPHKNLCNTILINPGWCSEHLTKSKSLQPQFRWLLRSSRPDSPRPGPTATSWRIVMRQGSTWLTVPFVFFFMTSKQVTITMKRSTFFNITRDTLWTTPFHCRLTGATFEQLCFRSLSMNSWPLSRGAFVEVPTSVGVVRSPRPGSPSWRKALPVWISWPATCPRPGENERAGRWLMSKG